jgi:hypothetical protein
MKQSFYKKSSNEKIEILEKKLSKEQNLEKIEKIKLKIEKYKKKIKEGNF